MSEIAQILVAFSEKLNFNSAAKVWGPLRFRHPCIHVFIYYMAYLNYIVYMYISR